MRVANPPSPIIVTLNVFQAPSESIARTRGSPAAPAVYDINTRRLERSGP
ncbi:hypothetical protein [Novosphingobium sp. 18050]|nr:hypothetical protein [Novosphingobium sp. 18050]